MNMDDKMTKMVSIIKQKDDAFAGGSGCKRYFAPKIPDSVQKNLVKYFDNHLLINKIIAYYDTSLLSTSNEGYLFTADGFYSRPLLGQKATYFHYADIIGVSIIKGDVHLRLNNSSFPEHTIYDSLSASALKDIILECQKIDKQYGNFSRKSTGKVQKLDLPQEKLDLCNGIIHTAAVACGGIGTGLAQIPASDNAAIVPIQIGMITSLGKMVFDLDITESAAKSIIASAGATIAGRTASQFLWGWIPGLGNAINTATAAGITELIGWIAVKDFYERWIEDQNKGRYEGMKAGYNAASIEYERKLKKQAEEFLFQKKNIEKSRDEYKKLLDEYEKYIAKLETENAELKKINEVREVYNNLRKLKST